MNYRSRRFHKVNRSLEFYLLLIGIILLLGLGRLSTAGEEEIGMLVFNISNQSSVDGGRSSDWKLATASGFRLKEGSPSPRIFTPNGDTKNDEVSFEYENIEESSIVCWIYDIKGSVVRQLDIVETGENKFTWDGKNEDGNVVRSGIYIYQIEVEGRTINGTIVLAK